MTKKTAKAKIFAKFLGGDSFFWPGVPVRDMTAEEWAALDDKTQAAVVAAGLFQLVAQED